MFKFKVFAKNMKSDEFMVSALNLNQAVSIAKVLLDGNHYQSLNGQPAKMVIIKDSNGHHLIDVFNWKVEK